ncbi:hypothetical protein EJB05_51589, partial [Eragrostis curvula]
QRKGVLPVNYFVLSGRQQVVQQHEDLHGTNSNKLRLHVEVKPICCMYIFLLLHLVGSSFLQQVVTKRMVASSLLKQVVTKRMVASSLLKQVVTKHMVGSSLLEVVVTH